MNILDLDANFHLLNVYICFVFQIARLETDNSKLRQRINMYEDSAKAMVGAEDLDEVTKAELLEKYSKNFLVFKRERRKSGPGGCSTQLTMETFVNYAHVFKVEPV